MTADVANQRLDLVNQDNRRLFGHLTPQDWNSFGEEDARSFKVGHAYARRAGTTAWPDR
jgi:hypothetical protein